MRKTAMAVTVAVAAALVQPAPAIGSEDHEWAALSAKLAGIKGVWTDQSYPGSVTSLMPDTALVGNGDVGITSGGRTGVKTFTVSKSDFWNANPEPSPAPIGGVSIQSTKKAPGANLALGATVTASSVHDGQTPDRAINGLWTRGYEGWVSEVGKPQWIALDLGTVQPVAQYIIRNDDAARSGNQDHTTKDVTFQTSADGTSWSDVDVVTGNTAATINRRITPVSTRHVRFQITEPTQSTTEDSVQNPRARIGQIELYQPQTDPDLTRGADASASTFHDTFFPDRAVNSQWKGGYEGWVSAVGKPKWYALDLGSVQQISRYVVKNDNAARPGNQDNNTKDMSFQTSVDGSTWSDVDAVTGNTADVIDRDISPARTRFVRFTVTEPTQGTTENSIQNPRARFGQVQLFPLTKAQEDPNAPAPAEPFREEQSILDAQVSTTMSIDGTPLSMRTWLAANDNIMVTSITSNGKNPVTLQSSTWSGAATAKSTYTNTAGANGDVSWAARATEPGKNWVSRAALATRVIGVNATAPTVTGATASTTFTLAPKRSAYVVTAIAGGGRNATEPQNAAVAKVVAQNDRRIEALRAEDVRWWQDYWRKSSVTLNDDVLEKYYYAAQYFIGSSSRAGKVAPGLYGVWTTTDFPSFHGDLHMNYNAMGPFYGVYSSNRPELALPYYDVMMDYLPEAQRRARDDLTRVKPDYIAARFPSGGVPEGVLFPVGIGPFGSTTDDQYLQQVGDSLFAATQFVSYYEYTQDRKFLKEKAFPFLKQVAAFFEHYLEWDAAAGQFVLWSGAQENDWGKNTSSDLGMLKQVLSTLVESGIPDPKLATWRNVLSHLPAQPTTVLNGKTVFSLAAPGTNQADIRPGNNTVNLEFIHPAGVLGINGDPAQRRIAIDTIDAMNSWGQENSFVKVFTQAARVGYPAQALIDQLKTQITRTMVANLRIADPYHGIEKSGTTEAINDMVVQTDKGITTVFPVWPSGKDASFERLLQPGAFVVSSEKKAGTVRFIDVTSNAGNRFQLINPWPGQQVTVTEHGRPIRFTNDHGVLSFPTNACGEYRIAPRH